MWQLQTNNKNWATKQTCQYWTCCLLWKCFGTNSCLVGNIHGCLMISKSSFWHSDGYLTSSLSSCQDEICISFWIDFKNLDVIPTARQKILNVHWCRCSWEVCRKQRVIMKSIKFYEATFKFELIIIGQDWYYKFSFFSSEVGTFLLTAVHLSITISPIHFLTSCMSPTILTNHILWGSIFREFILHSKSRHCLGCRYPGDDEAAGGDFSNGLWGVHYWRRLGGLTLCFFHCRNGNMLDEVFMFYFKSKVFEIPKEKKRIEHLRTRAIRSGEVKASDLSRSVA